MQETEPYPELLYAHFFYVDIVGLSDPKISVKRQMRKIKVLNNLIASSKIIRTKDRNSIRVFPSGDGMAVGFLQGPELPLKLAIELHRKLNAYNKGLPPEATLQVRIGMNDGAVFMMKDMWGNQNCWGPGIILARRVMDVGDDGHILLTARMAEALRDLSDEYKVMIKPLRDYTIKHGQRLLLYSVYGNGIGNSAIPATNSYQKSRIKAETERLRRTTAYKKIDVTLTATDPKTMLAHHKRVYNLENISRTPIRTVLLGIATDVPKSFAALNIRILDESRKNLKITSINLDKPYQKELTTSFNKPIRKGERNRGYTLEYDVEEPERYFENYFRINCEKYRISLVYPSKAGFKPAVYDVDVENDTKTKAAVQPAIRKIKRGLSKATWTKTDILESQAFRLEW